SPRPSVRTRGVCRSGKVMIRARVRGGGQDLASTLRASGPYTLGSRSDTDGEEAMNERILAPWLLAGAAFAVCGAWGTAVADERGTAYTYPDGSPHPVTPW